ncbi:helix-turn-helix domain-containing GNAT family N-acetyltransferase [Streptomyces sp. N2-109]|uniref:Helix-turn-helix domain-containing GNAT family N-acetyltransferase n=1 Tax=Streptomyces gossypii TaxID=2883101 RepID=A0ABT2JT38_9ACTN|nr:helix-turn-helix domain-containing GNAT family N-acetyltransferase [Streptomyces gossypii]MCT2591051.1 helix-turn-helix domain-containing GNAT family N-acetyltransferase [Streptomyces gossypii]
MSVTEVRAFNRFYTNLIGALDYSKHLYTPYTLTEARILYELAHAAPLDTADLRLTLSLDAGYLSRLLQRFEQDGLLVREQSAEDARRRRVALTEQGREAAALLEERSLESTGELLGSLTAADRERLAAAMRTIRSLLGGKRESPLPSAQPRPQLRPEVTLRAPAPGDLGWIVQRHGALYAQEYGWDVAFEALVARIVADFAEGHDPRWERAWIAELGGAPVGSVMCVRDDGAGEPASATARLRLLLVEPSARGRGIGDLLVRACVGFARDAGYRELVLWTNDVLGSARRIYERAGFTLTAESPHHSYGAELVGQDWRLIL